MKHVIDAMHYWAEKAPENMAVPFIITIEVLEDRIYTIEGENVWQGEFTVAKRVYIEDEDKTKFQILGYIDLNDDVEDAVHKLMHDDLKKHPVSIELDNTSLFDAINNAL